MIKETTAPWISAAVILAGVFGLLYLVDLLNDGDYGPTDLDYMTRHRFPSTERSSNVVSL